MDKDRDRKILDMARKTQADDLFDLMLKNHAWSINAAMDTPPWAGGTPQQPSPFATMPQGISPSDYQKIVEIMTAGRMFPSATAPKPRPPLPKEFLVGPIVGYRAWTVTNDGLLAAMNGMGKTYLPGTAVNAVCDYNGSGHDKGEKPPANRCTCGYYVWASPDRLLNEIVTSNRIVAGSCCIWGKCIKHKDGYRAEFAYPLALWVPRSPMPGFPMAPSPVVEIAKRYGITTVEMPEPEPAKAE